MGRDILLARDPSISADDQTKLDIFVIYELIVMSKK